MSQHDTNVQCPVCKQAKVVAEVELAMPPFTMDTPIGPESGSSQLEITSFHCSNPNCMVLFHHPPGKPNAAEEILQEARSKSGFEQ